MSRTKINIKYSNFEGLQNKLSDLLTQKGYKIINYNNENVWSRGMGFWTAKKFIKIEFADNRTLIVSGWITPFGGEEQDLNGIVGSIPKKQIMSVIKKNAKHCIGCSSRFFFLRETFL